MKNMTRGEFMKIGAGGLAVALAPSRLWAVGELAGGGNDDLMLKKLINNNDLAVDRFLNTGDSRPRPMFSRALGEEFATEAASYCQPDSKYYKSPALQSRLDAIISKLLDLQYPGGMLDSGGNRQSPPDTAFVMDHLCPASNALKADASGELQSLKEKLALFLAKVGEGLLTGGVHTPNHRWEVSAALAQLYSVNRDERYLRRIDDWLDEGIDINDDGNFSERSRLYAVVVDRSLLTIGRILNRPSLFEPVRKNLEATYYYMEANGELVTLDSRRQDQYQGVSILSYYLAYRNLALYYNDDKLASITKLIEAFPEFERRVLSRTLIFFMENPLLFKNIEANRVPEATFSRFFPQSALLRIRRDGSSASVFGGNDKPVTIASGRSTNPTFFTFRKGSAILDYVRMSTSFFSTGYFRSDGLERDGTIFRLHEKKEAYYYQPLPKEKRKVDGNYPLSESVDRRFWSKMDFRERPTTTLTLDSSIEIEEREGAYELSFALDGPKDVEVTIDICFRPGGRLEGAVAIPETEDFYLKEGFAKYTSGSDVIDIGPGRQEHSNTRMLDGEEYSTHFGSIKGKGPHLFMTGLLPFKHTITIR